MRYTQDQLRKLWKVLVETKDIPRRIGGMTATERGALIKEIRAQQKRVNKQRAKRASMLEQEGLPEEVQIHGTVYRRVLDSARDTLDKAHATLDKTSDAAMAALGDALVAECKETLDRAGVNYDGVNFDTFAANPYGSFYTRTTTKVTIPTDTGETDGNKQRVSEDDARTQPASQSAEPGGRGAAEPSSTGGSGDGSTYETGDGKAAYDW